MLIQSLIFVPTFPLRRLAGEATLGEPNMPHDQQQSQLSWVHTKTGPSKVGDVAMPPGPWTTSVPLSVGVASRTCLTNLSCGILDTWPNRRSGVSRFGEVV